MSDSEKFWIYFDKDFKAEITKSFTWYMAYVCTQDGHRLVSLNLSTGEIAPVVFVLDNPDYCKIIEKAIIAAARIYEVKSEILDIYLKRFPPKPKPKPQKNYFLEGKLRKEAGIPKKKPYKAPKISGKKSRRDKKFFRW